MLIASKTNDKQNLYNEIVKPNIIQNRLLALRKAYKLTLDEMTSVTENLMSRATINSWETGVRVPAIDGLQIISSSFGVSIDWLCGISNVPYTEYSVNTAKNIYFKNTIKIFKDYKIDKNFLKSYPIEIQANIIVLLRLKEFYSLRPNSIEYKNKTDRLLKSINEKAYVCKIQKEIKNEYY